MMPHSRRRHRSAQPRRGRLAVAALAALGAIAASALLVSMPRGASAAERPLYMASVLYLGESATPADTVEQFGGLDSTAASDSAATGGATSSAPALSQPDTAATMPPLVVPIAGAVVGGSAVGLGGALLGVAFVNDHSSSEDWESIGAAALGFFVGEVVGVAAGAHFGNGGRGSFGRDLLVSFLLGIGTVGIAGATGGFGGFPMLAAQITLTALTERSSARARAARAANPTAP